MIKGSIQEENTTILSIYAPNIGAPKYIKQVLTNIREKLTVTVKVGTFDTSLITLDRSSRQKNQWGNIGLKWHITPDGYCGAAGAGRWPGPGFQFPLKWWDSPPPSGNLEPANQHAPSKKKGTYQGKAEKPANAQVWKKPVWRFGPIRLLCKHVTNPLKPATNCLCTPYKLGNSLGSALSDPLPLRWTYSRSPDLSQQ